MNTIIFYFSGTGNSLLVARQIAAKMGDVPILSMTSMTDELAPKSGGASVVGFVFPVYFYALPELVKAFVRKCVFEPDSYFFAAVTSGGYAGNALFELDTILREKNSRLHYGVEVPLGDNSIAIRTPANVVERRFSEADSLLDPLVRAVCERDRSSIVKNLRRSQVAALKGATIRLAMRRYYQYEDRRVDDAVCSNCGLCEKICPVGNITISSREDPGQPEKQSPLVSGETASALGQVRIRENCVSCFACINYCPKQAIHFGQIHPRKETQYRVPGIKATDLCGNGGDFVR